MAGTSGSFHKRVDVVCVYLGGRGQEYWRAKVKGKLAQVKGLRKYMLSTSCLSRNKEMIGSVWC